MSQMKKTSARMIYHLIILMVARLVSPMVSFVIMILVARFWGQDLLGQYSTVLVWMVIFHYLSLFGITEYLSKEVGAHRSEAQKYQTHGLLFVLLSSLLCWLVMAGGVIIFNYPREIKIGILIATLALPFHAAILISQAMFTAFEKIGYIAFTWIAENLLFLVLGALVIIHGWGLVNLIWCLILTRILAASLNLCLIHRFVVPLSYTIDWKFLWNFLPPLIIFGISGVSYQIFMRIDVVMLSKMADMATVGLYSSASKLTETCLLLPSTFYLLNLPRAARGYQNFPDNVNGQIASNCQQLFILVFLAFGFGFYFAEDILGLIFGGAFVAANWILKILLLGFVIQSAEVVLSMSGQAAGYLKEVMHISVSRTIVNIALNFLLIPIWGALGAALATLLATILSFVALHYFAMKKLEVLPWLRIIKRPALVCLLSIFLLIPATGRIPILLQGSLFFLAYGFWLLVLNRFSLKQVITL